LFCGASWFFNAVYIIFEKLYPHKVFMSILNTFSENSIHRSCKESGESGDEAGAEGKTITWASIKELPYSYWMVCLITLCMYSTTWPFVALAVDMYSTKWGIVVFAGDFD